MNALVRSRRRRKRRARLQRILLAVIVVAVLAAFGARAALDRPEFRITSVAVSGVHRVSAADVRSAAGIAPGANAWFLNPWAITGRVERLPYVAQARVDRTPPNHVTIRITERKPIACADAANGVVTIDATQRVLERGCTQPLHLAANDAKAPAPGNRFESKLLARLRDDAVAVGVSGLELRDLHLDRDRELVAVSSGGAVVLLGADGDLPEKVRLIAPIINAVAKQGHHVAQLDLRAPTTPTVRYKDSATAAGKASGVK